MSQQANDRPEAVQGTGEAEHPDPYRWATIGLGLLFALMIPVIFVVMIAFQPAPQVLPWVTEARQLGVEPLQLVRGELTFKGTCAVCHGQDAQGVVRLGKPLRNSEYVQAHTDEELFDVIAQGRTAADPVNTTGTAMPPRAGNPRLRDKQLRNVVFYLRTLQDPSVEPVTLEDWIAKTTEAAGQQVAGLVGAASGIGHDVFLASCSACHGPGGEGMEGLGKPLAGSDFVKSRSDKELVAFIKTGRPIWDAENTTGVDMPAKGGNPALSDEEIDTIITYIRALHAGE